MGTETSLKMKKHSQVLLVKQNDPVFEQTWCDKVLPIKWLPRWEYHFFIFVLGICHSLISSLVWENLSRILSYKDPHSAISLIWAISLSSLHIRVLLSLCLIFWLILNYKTHSCQFSSLFCYHWKMKSSEFPTVFNDKWKKRCLWSAFILSQEITAFFWQCNKRTKRWQFISHFTAFRHLKVT